MSAAGSGPDLYRIVEDVGGLKREARNIAESQKAQWSKIDKIEDVLTEISRKLDRVLEQGERLDELEKAIADYRAKKSIALGIVTGLGLAGGAIGQGLTHWLAKLFGGHS